jgi:hypothetical protein
MEDEIYSQFDLWFTEKLAWLLFAVSIISTGLLLWLAYSGGSLSRAAAVAAVLLGSFTITLGLCAIKSARLPDARIRPSCASP